ISGDPTVAVRGGRGVQNHGVGEQGREQHGGGRILGHDATRPEALHDQGRCRAHGIEGGGDGRGGLDVSYVMVVQDLYDLGVLDTLDALADLAVVDEQDTPRFGVQEVSPRHDPDGHPPIVNGDGGPVVDLHDLLGYLAYEVVWVEGQGVLTHDLPAGDGELYEAARHVGIDGRDHDGGSPLPC